MGANVGAAALSLRPQTVQSVNICSLQLCNATHIWRRKWAVQSAHSFLFLPVGDRYQSAGSAEVKCKCVKYKNLIGNTGIMSSIVLKWSNLFPECGQIMCKMKMWMYQGRDGLINSVGSDLFDIAIEGISLFYFSNLWREIFHISTICLCVKENVMIGRKKRFLFVVVDQT